MINPKDIDKAHRRIGKLVQQRRLAKQEIDALVLLLRSPGLDGACSSSWQDIGDALSITRQAAQQYYDRYL